MAFDEDMPRSAQCEASRNSLLVGELEIQLKTNDKAREKFRSINAARACFSGLERRERYLS